MALQLTWFHHTSPLSIRWVETVSCGAKSELPAGGGIIPPKGFSFLLLRLFLCPPSDFNNFCLTIQSTRPVVTFLFLHLLIRSFPGTVIRIIQMTRSDGKLFVPWWCLYRLEASLKQFRNAFTTWDITQRTVLISCPSISVARISCLHCEFGIEEEEEETAFSQLFTYLFGKQTQANRIPNWNRLVPLTTTCSHSSSDSSPPPDKGVLQIKDPKEIYDQLLRSHESSSVVPLTMHPKFVGGIFDFALSLLFSFWGSIVLNWNRVYLQQHQRRHKQTICQ